MNTIAYNPLARAASAAWAELTTPDAIQWYSDRAYNDTLTTWAATQNLCTWLVATAKTFWEWAELQLNPPAPAVAQLLLPGGKIIGYLPPCAPLEALERVLVTPAPAAVLPAPAKPRAKRGRKPKAG